METVHRYARSLGLDPGITVHSLRFTALTTARERDSDIIDLQDFAGQRPDDDALLGSHASSGVAFTGRTRRRPSNARTVKSSTIASCSCSPPASPTGSGWRSMRGTYWASRTQMAHTLCSVVFERGASCKRYEADDQITEAFNSAFDESDDDLWTIIGNVHQNPELLSA